MIKSSMVWGNEDNMMYVVGATQVDMLANVRKYIPDHFLLIPGIGSQGGSLDDVVKYGMTKECGLIVNSSRALIYAGEGLDFASRTRAATEAIQSQMDTLLKQSGI